MFVDETLYKDVLSNNQDIIDKRHNIYGVMFIITGVMILVFWLKTLKKKA